MGSNVLLPASSTASPISAQTWAMTAAAFAVSATALVGLYPQFDDGKLRVLVGVTSGPLAALAVWVALRARSRGGAIACAFGAAAAFGVMNTILPAMALTALGDSLSAFPMMMFFGVLFGTPVGLVYGLFLAMLVALVHEPREASRAASLDAIDLAKVSASIWCVVVAGLGCVLGVSIGAPAPTLVVAGAVVVAAALSAALVGKRWRARSLWVARVRDGRVPHLRVRSITGADRRGDAAHASLVCIAEGTTVIEWVPTEPAGAYRLAPVGEPIAIIADARGR